MSAMKLDPSAKKNRVHIILGQVRGELKCSLLVNGVLCLDVSLNQAVCAESLIIEALEIGTYMIEHNLGANRSIRNGFRHDPQAFNNMKSCDPLENDLWMVFALKLTERLSAYTPLSRHHSPAELWDQLPLRPDISSIKGSQQK